MHDSRQKRFLEVADQYKEVIARVCSVYSSETAPFADLYQEVMINLWLGLESWRGDAKMSTWIYRIAINTCITWQRRYRRGGHEISLDGIFDIPDTADDRMAAMHDIHALISRLNQFDKALITLWLEEKSYDEISQILGITKTNVATRLSRVREKLSSMYNS